jgi:hypothetical protein
MRKSVIHNATVVTIGAHLEKRKSVIYAVLKKYEFA